MQTQGVPWMVGTHRGLFHEGKQFKYGEPVPGIERLPNLKTLIELRWLIPNDKAMVEQAIGEETVSAHAKEESKSLAESKKPASKRRNMLGRKKATRKRAQRAVAAGAE